MRWGKAGTRVLAAEVPVQCSLSLSAVKILARRGEISGPELAMPSCLGLKRTSAINQEVCSRQAKWDWGKCRLQKKDPQCLLVTLIGTE